MNIDSSCVARGGGAKLTWRCGETFLICSNTFATQFAHFPASGSARQLTHSLNKSPFDPTRERASAGDFVYMKNSRHVSQTSSDRAFDLWRCTEFLRSDDCALHTLYTWLPYVHGALRRIINCSGAAVISWNIHSRCRSARALSWYTQGSSQPSRPRFKLGFRLRAHCLLFTHRAERAVHASLLILENPQRIKLPLFRRLPLHQ